MYRCIVALALLSFAVTAAGKPVARFFEEEPENTGWAFYADNDMLAAREVDRDYTGGFSLTVSGQRARDARISLDGMRRGADRFLHLDRLYADSAYQRHSLEAGLTIFTPGNLEDPDQQVGDRPYASLLYLASTGVEVVPERDAAYISTFTLGALGLPLIDDLQRGLHKALGAAEPVGWDRQVSDGGELMFRYSFARANRAWSGPLGNGRGELTTTWRASLGYLTEVSFGVASRIGRIRTPWWSYNPQIADYAEKSVPIAAHEGRGREEYVWAGFNLRARVYNAFLQGQFRDSEVTFVRNDLRPLVLEAWLGYTKALDNGWRFSYVLRGQSSEIRKGPGDREVFWGGLIVSRAF